MKTMLNRRMFLQGAGGALVAMPLLESLLPKRVRSQVPRAQVRYVQWMTNHGQYPESFWPAASDESILQDDVGEGVRSMPLSAISGSISPVIDSSFDTLRSKLTLLRGLDVIRSRNLHNASAPTCASTNRGSGTSPCDSHTCFDFQYSVDAVLEDYGALYPEAVRSRALRLSPGVVSRTKWGSFCWRDGERLFAHDTTQGAIEEIFGDAVASGGGQSAAEASRLQLTNQVMDDYRRVRDGAAISRDDQRRLSDYMDLIAQIQSRSQVQTPECGAPPQAAEADYTELHHNAVDIVSAAIACGATRVVAYHCFHSSASEADGGPQHDWAHNKNRYLSEHTEMQRYRYAHFRRLAQNLDGMLDTDGNTVLDNCILYSSNELSAPDHGNGHMIDLPILMAGSGGGQLRTGEYIDFGHRPINNLLVTFLNAMGLRPADYERNGIVGFGDYEADTAEMYSAYTGMANRRNPLPYLYLGA